MTKPMNRSKSKRKLFVKTPGGNTVTRYKRRKKNKLHYSSISHEPLRGVSSKPNIPKSHRVPSRKYAGHLSPSELKLILKYANRVQQGMIKMDNVDIKYRKYVKVELKE